MNIVARNNISGKLKKPASEIGYYSYTNRWQQCFHKSTKVNRFTFIVLILFSFLSCQNYDSDEYIKIENEAINDIILEMTDFEEMKKLNNWKNQKLNLYIISKLDTTTAGTPRPNGYDTGANGINYSKEKIEKNKKEFEINSERYRKEEHLFCCLKKRKNRSSEPRLFL